MSPTSTTAASSSSRRRNPGSSSILSALNEDALVKVAHAAEAARALGTLSTASKQLCSLYMNRVPVQLHVYDKEKVALVQRLLASGRPLFNNCTELALSEEDVANCRLAVQLLGGVQCTALQKLWLEVSPDAEQQQQQQQQQPQVEEQVLLPGQACNHSPCSILRLPALQHLHYLHLEAAGYDPRCIAQHLGLLPRLTHVTLLLRSSGTAEDAPADLSALARLTNVLALRWLDLPPVLPAAGCEGPFSLPSSLTRLEVGGYQLGEAPIIGGWVTHLAGCPQLQELLLTYAPSSTPAPTPVPWCPCWWCTRRTSAPWPSVVCSWRRQTGMQLSQGWQMMWKWQNGGRTPL